MTEVVEEVTIHFVFDKVFPKIMALLDNAESHNVLLRDHGYSGYVNAPQFCIVLKFPIVLESNREQISAVYFTLN